MKFDVDYKILDIIPPQKGEDGENVTMSMVVSYVGDKTDHFIFWLGEIVDMGNCEADFRAAIIIEPEEAGEIAEIRAANDIEHGIIIDIFVDIVRRATLGNNPKESE